MSQRPGRTSLFAQMLGLRARQADRQKARATPAATQAQNAESREAAAAPSPVRREPATTKPKPARREAQGSTVSAFAHLGTPEGIAGIKAWQASMRARQEMAARTGGERPNGRPWKTEALPCPPRLKRNRAEDR